MKRKHLMELISAILLVLFCSQFNFVRCNEQDFDDGDMDGTVHSEEIQDTENEVDDTEKIEYQRAKYDPTKFYFVDDFDDVDASKERWITSDAKKDDIAEEIAKYDGKWEWESPIRIVSKKDIGLVLKSKAKHSAISARLNKQFTFDEEKPLVVQYEVTLQEGQNCGGAYIKLLSAGKHLDNLKSFNDKTPYTIMFGPDKCGNDIKMHFIFRHVNPINGSISEKHSRKPKDRLEEPFNDKLPHLYQLIIRTDNTFEIRLDHKVINEGSLLNDFLPPVNPPREIDDPEDKKPEDWDEREKIPDPESKKPDDWDEDAPPQIPDPDAVKPDGWLDEPVSIPDPNANKPEDWDSEIDGEWEPPMVDNPVCETAVGCGEWSPPLIPNKNYKGKWRATFIDNPNYKGKWAARKIPNPDFFEDLNPFKMTPIDAIGIELWSMSSDILFDNFIVTDDVDLAKDFSAQTFDVKRKFIDQESESIFNKFVDYLADNPWVWRISIVVIGVPLVFFIYRLCTKKDAEEDSKKTDAVTEDDKISDMANVETSQSQDISSLTETKVSDSDVKHSRPNAEDEEVAPLEDEDDAEDDNETPPDEDSEGNQNEINPSDETKESATIKADIRKRKSRVRKDES